jgi:hypothetical protein
MLDIANDGKEGGADRSIGRDQRQPRCIKLDREDVKPDSADDQSRHSASQTEPQDSIHDLAA